MCRAERTDVTEWNIVWIKISTTQFNSSDCYSLSSIARWKWPPPQQWAAEWVRTWWRTLLSPTRLFSLIVIIIATPLLPFDDTRMHINLVRIVQPSRSDNPRLDETRSKYCRTGVSERKSAEMFHSHIRALVQCHSRSGSCSDFDENAAIKV